MLSACLIFCIPTMVTPLKEAPMQLKLWMALEYIQIHGDPVNWMIHLAYVLCEDRHIHSGKVSRNKTG